MEKQISQLQPKTCKGVSSGALLALVEGIFLYENCGTNSISFTIGVRNPTRPIFTSKSLTTCNWLLSCSSFQWHCHWGQRMWGEMRQCGPVFAWRAPKRHGQMYSGISANYLTELPAGVQAILLIIYQMSEVRFFKKIHSQSAR